MQHPVCQKSRKVIAQDITKLYMRRHAELKLKPKTINEYQNQLPSDIYPFIGHRRVDNEELTKRYRIVNRATIYKWIDKKNFPKQIKIGGKALWLRAEIEQYDEVQMQKRFD
jgi:predicted DNA-binding transcriptional regulator AlpA